MASPGSTSLRRYLARLIFFAAGPLVVLAAVLAAVLVLDTRSHLEADGNLLARSAAQILDRGIAARQSGLTLLSSARSLATESERARGYELADNFRQIYGSHVLVAGLDSQMLINTRVPLDRPLPKMPQPKGRSAMAETLATGKPAIGDVVQGPVAGVPLVALSAPILRDGRLQAVLVTTLERSFFVDRLGVAGISRDWSVRLLDSVGEVIAATGPEPDHSFGSHVFRAPVGVAPWQVEIQIPAAAYWQPVVNAAVIPVLALVLATAAGLLGGGVAAGRLQSALRALDADRITERPPASGIAEVDGLGLRLAESARVLHSSESSYRLLFDAHPQPMGVVHVHTQRFLAINEAAVQHYGYSREEFLAMTLADLHSAEESGRLQPLLQDLQAAPAEGVHDLGEWTHRVRDGRLIQVEITSSAIEFEGVAARLVLAVDVTERNALTREREAVRDAAARSLALVRDVLARVGSGFVVLDRNLVLTFANDRAAELLGLASAAAMLGKSKPELMPDRNTSPFQLACDRALLSQKPEVIETFFHPTGRWLENRIYPSEAGLSVHFIDITERKLTQDALVKSERDFRVLAEQIPAIVYRVQLATGQVDYVSPRIQGLGYTQAEWAARPGRMWEVIHPEDRPLVEDALRQALQSHQQVLHLAYRVRDTQGQWHHMDDHLAIVRPDDGQTPFMLGVNVDVTEARVATAALQRSELLFRRLAEQVPAVIYRARLSGDGPALYVSPHIATLGYTVAQWTSAAGPNWPSTLHPDDAARVRAQLRNFSPQHVESTMEYRLRDAWGRWRHFIDHSRVVDGDDPDHDAGDTQVQGVMVEVTFLKLTEQALRQAEADQRSLFEAMAEGVLVMDDEHHVIDANASAASMLGYPREELLRMRLQELLPEHERARAPGVIAALLASPDARFVQWDNRRRDGRVFPAEASVRPAGGSRYVKVFRNVTDRLASEQARVDYQRDLSNLTQRLMSQERETSRHLAQTLHDHLGQSLAVSRLRLDAVTVAQGHLMADALKSEWARVGQSLDQAIADVRLVLGDLRPPMLEEQGLLAALDNEVRVRNRDGLKLDVVLELDDAGLGTRWPADVEYCAFMVAREAIVNAQLHADASLVRVIVTGDRRRLDLEVLDDGRGIPDEMRAGRPGHLGLVGMRERASAIGAQFSVQRVPEGGTRVWLQWQESTQ
jgi:hypothetical protein